MDCNLNFIGSKIYSNQLNINELSDSEYLIANDMEETMLQERRVVVTGMGTVNSIGQDLPTFWQNCCKGTSGIRPISNFFVPPECSGIAGIVKDFYPGKRLSRMVSVETLDRSTQFALAAAEEAMTMSGLTTNNVDLARYGVFLSTAIGQIDNMEREFLHQSADGQISIPVLDQPQPSTLLKFLFSTTAKTLLDHFGFEGSYTMIPTGCTGGLDAIGYAMSAVRSGEVDVAITGSTEAPITPLVVAAFAQIGATSMRNKEPQQASRPFDVDRDGFVLAEGCGILVIESLEHARNRGATIMAELAGYGSLNNCFHMTDIPADGKRIADSSMIAMQDAKITPDEIDAINAHGSSTPQNDIAETNAYWQLFGERAEKIPVTSLKSQIGHPLAAANSIEVIETIQTLLTGIVPPTINLDRQDPQCRLNVVGNTARETSAQCILKTSSGFSGIHSSLIVRQYKES
jgi:3-oxoacyl-(acyl-carrier-protein) synthase